jgi:hypothetical protein
MAAFLRIDARWRIRMSTATAKRAPGSLAERFWSIAHSSGPAGGDDTTNPEPRAVVRHVLRILDALSAGEVGDGVSHSSVSFLQLLRQQEQLGDLSYASPEQARGESLDERSLVFSVGVLLFEELTGRHPFGAMASGRRFARIQKCELGSGVQYFPQVPGELRGVLMRAMGPFPEERFKSLAELRVQLERFVGGGVNESLERMQPRVRRPLKGLPPTPADLAFAPTEDVIPTMVQPRVTTLPGPARALASTAAAMPAKSLLMTPVDVSPSNGTDRVASLKSLPRAYAILERAAYVAIGALVALIAAYLVARPKAPAKTAAPVAVAEAAPQRNLEPPALAVAEPQAIFDAELGGRNAAAAARGCFSPERATRTISFGAGLLFAKDAAESRRTYLSPDEPLATDERRCIAKALTGVSAGAAPAKNSIVEYRFRLRADGHDEVRATLQK